MLKGQVFAGGARKVGMNMQVGDKFHFVTPPIKRH
jgi:hypothetical protein